MGRFYFRAVESRCAFFILTLFALLHAGKCLENLETTSSSSVEPGPLSQQCFWPPSLPATPPSPPLTSIYSLLSLSVNLQWTLIYIRDTFLFLNKSDWIFGHYVWQQLGFRTLINRLKPKFWEARSLEICIILTMVLSLV